MQVLEILENHECHKGNFSWRPGVWGQLSSFEKRLRLCFKGESGVGDWKYTLSPRLRGTGYNTDLQRAKIKILTHSQNDK